MKKTPRKPKPRRPRMFEPDTGGIHSAAIENGRPWVILRSINDGFFDGPKDMRRFATWLIKAADYLEHQSKRGKG